MTLETESKGGGSKQDEVHTQENETTSPDKAVDRDVKARFILEKNTSVTHASLY